MECLRKIQSVLARKLHGVCALGQGISSYQHPTAILTFFPTRFDFIVVRITFEWTTHDYDLTTADAKLSFWLDYCLKRRISDFPRLSEFFTLLEKTNLLPFLLITSSFTYMLLDFNLLISGEVFLSAFSKAVVLDVYSDFINNFSVAMELAKMESKRKSALADFFKVKQISAHDRLSFFGLMVKPVQRFPQFIMFLQVSGINEIENKKSFFVLNITIHIQLI